MAICRGAGRLVDEAQTDGGSGTSWADASSLAGDQVLTQTLTTYDADGNPILVADKQRFNTDTPSQTGPLGDPTTGPQARVSYTASYYDNADRPTATVDVGTDGGSAYTPPANPPAPSDTTLVTTFAYNSAGDLQFTTDPRGVVTEDSYDALGRLTREIDAYTDGTPTASTNQTTNYTYDGIGDVTSVQVMMPAGSPYADQMTYYQYGVNPGLGSAISSNDLLAAIQYPDPTTGQPGESASDRQAYTYDALGDTTTATDPNGTTHTYAYDVLGRQVSDAVTTLGAGVDGSVLRHTTAYDALGLPDLSTSYDAASGGSIVNQVQDVYNGLGQLTGEYQEQDGAVNTASSPEVRYAYTEMAGGQNNSRLTRMVYPNGRAIDYVYNSGLDGSISRLGAIADDNSGTPGTTLEGYTYLGLGTIVQYAHPQTGINLTYIQQAGDTKSINDAGDPYVGLDRFGRVIDQNWFDTGTGTSTDRFQYAYDRSGDVLDSNNLVNPAESELYQANGASSNSAYDPLGRLTAFARGTLSSSGNNGTGLDTIAGPSASQSWSLDSVGNWAGVTTDGSTTTQAFNAQNQATGTTAPTFDNDGNTTGDAGLTYTYDAWDQLVSARNGSTAVASYAYDALGRRITEADGSGSTGHLYYSPQWQVIEERQGGTAASDVSYQYVWGAGGVDQLVLRDAYTGGTIVPAGRLYAQWDANGDVTALVNTSGQVVERDLYDPYGSVTVTDANWNPLAGNTSAYDWRYLFQGGRIDTATGWYDFRNRDLIPSEGRWAERDPLGLAAGDPNIYRFVFNSPSTYTDPLGLGLGSLILTGQWNAPQSMWDAAMEGYGQGYKKSYNTIAPAASYVFAAGSMVKETPAGLAASAAGAGLVAMDPNVPEPGALQVYTAAGPNPRGRPVFIVRPPIQRPPMARPVPRRPASVPRTPRAAGPNTAAGTCPAPNTVKPGSFSVRDWTGYPSGSVPKPSGPFRLLEGAEYEAARKAANQANAALRRADPAKYAGKQIHEIQPVKYGGSPTDPANKIALTPQEHARYTTWWNRFQRSMEQ